MTLTNNSNRTEPAEANPRAPNPHGHLVELIEDNDDAGALTFRWDIFVKCGNPAVPEDDTTFGDIVDPVAEGVSPISDPDNIVFDDDGHLWIATDGQFFSGDDGFGQNDGVFAVPVEGEDRGLLRQFLSYRRLVRRYTELSNFKPRRAVGALPLWDRQLTSRLRRRSGAVSSRKWI